MTFDQLCVWFLYCDRRGEDVIVPRAHIEKAIRDAAKDEGKELERMPWETGTEHDKRLQTTEK